MTSVLAWWLASSIAGAAAFPIAWRLFDRLPDRGLGLSRIFGILLGGYLMWLLSSVGLLRNGAAGAVAALLLVAGGGILAARGRWREMRDWLRGNLRTLLGVEAVFLAAFVGWTIVRAFNPEIVATEKPMELAFLNAILRSPSFPPPDPWLSGHAISYYYLGYVVLAWISWLTGVAGGVAFNLGNALWFALVAVGAYSLVFNLLALRYGTPRRWAALLGPLMVVLVGNLAGVFEVMHSLHLFWERQPDGSQSSAFWTWLNLDDLTTPPAGEPAFPPDRFWFWWQGARVVSDIDLAGNHVEVIDEFPFFSFLLADNHPHVLALPFAVMALAVALQAFRTGSAEGFRLSWIRAGPRALSRAAILVGVLLLAAAIVRAGLAIAGGAAVRDALAMQLRFLVLGLAAAGALWAFLWVISGQQASALPTRELILAGWLSGCLAFLNTWDLPIYLGLIVAAATWPTVAQGWGPAVRRALWTGAAAVVLAILFVALWVPTFSSQAGGILPNMIFPTRLVQFLIMFLVVLFPIGLWLVFRTRAQVRLPGSWKTILGITVGVPLLLAALSWLMGALMVVVAPDQVQTAIPGLGATGLAEVAAESLARRLASPWSALLVGFLIALGWLYLRRLPGDPRQGVGVFVILMVLLGAFLVILPEFFYLRDSFGSRMNTVFKLWYAAWLLWAIAAAYVLAWPWESFGRAGRPLLVVAIIPVILGLVYTTTGLWERTSHFRIPGGPQLDGTAHLDTEVPGDATAIRWMRASLAPAVIAEAIGGSYSQYARVSVHTGFPTVLGWDFHEFQWRGDWAPQGTRQDDISRLYQTQDWVEAKAILDQYDIRYVYVGPLERSTYAGISTDKFDAYMTKLYDQDDVRIYVRRDRAGT